MKKINLKDLELNIDISQIMNLIVSKSDIYIDLDGNIFTTEENLEKNILIYKSKNKEELFTIFDAKTLAMRVFKDFKPNIIGTICKIKPVMNWQNIIELNKKSMLYFDHQSDGVEIFEDEILESFGWYANDLEINYREISEFIESNCDGKLVCYDNEIQFSGFVIVNNIEEVRLKVKDFIIKKANENIKNEIIDIEDEDVIKALEFFGIRI